MGFKELRRDLPIEEFDYQILTTYLEEYQNKRDKITRLLKEKKILRIKKGIYIFGPDYQKGLVCKETLANILYGPSYISFEYALSLHGFIPERVETVTSATTGRQRTFNTPIGSFSYRHLSLEKYSIGVALKHFGKYHSALLATAEKALIDQIYAAKGLSKLQDMEAFFFEDLRIEPNSLQSLSLSHLEEISEKFQSPKVERAIKFIEKVQSHG